MTRRTIAILAVLACTAGTAAAQQPSIQNGHVTPKPSTSIARDVTSAGGTAADPVWVGWREPMIAGNHAGCSQWWVDNAPVVRGELLDNPANPSDKPSIAPATGPLPLEGGSGVVILLRVVDNKVERLRTISDDCPIDANGRAVTWLTGVSAADSIAYLDTLTKRDDTMATNVSRSIASSALGAVALHRDAAADAVLDRIAGTAADDQRQSAVSLLATLRGAHGFATIQKMLASERSPDFRRTLASALGSTREPGTADALLALAKNDADPKVRAAAIYAYTPRAGAAGLTAVTSVINQDADESVKTRAVTSLSRLPDDGGLPTLIQLARTSNVLAVKKEAVRVLGTSKDARATAFLRELIAK
jgi:hypothetical protein